MLLPYNDIPLHLRVVGSSQRKKKSTPVALERYDAWENAAKHLPSPHGAEFVATHYESIRCNQSLKHSNVGLGQVFELVTVQALLLAGFDPNEIDIRGSSGPYGFGKNVDLDIVVNKGGKPLFCLLLKTSLRERVKQWDRDAMLARLNRLKAPMYGIFWKEQPEHTIEHGIAFAKDREQECHMVEVINAYEYDRLNELVYNRASNNVHG